MPYATSTSHKFIFIHINKTAGTSIHAAMKPHLDERQYGVNIYPGPHAYACQLQRHFGTQFDNAFTFAFVRNPWARMLSLYSFLKDQYRKGKPILAQYHRSVGGTPFQRDFNHWLCNCEYFDERRDQDVPQVPFQKRDQMTWLTDYQNKNMIVDFVGKVENLSNDWKFICAQTNMPHINLPTKRTSKHQHYREVYNQQSIDFVAKYFRRDIEEFGYDF